MASRSRGKKGKRSSNAQFGFAVLLLLGIAFSLYIYKHKNINTLNFNSIAKNIAHLFNPHKDDTNKALRLVDGADGSRLFGIDMSHYQGKVDWEKLNSINSTTPISFMILRATMGKSGKDRHFKEYWQQARHKNIVMGAYHYYRPNEPGLPQAQNFIESVKLLPGDLLPVIDIEKEPRKRKIAELKTELSIFINAIEKHYGVKPILYTGDSFYQSYLATGEFDHYPLWIANYNLASLPKTSHWVIWQFSERGKLEGINENVDLNIFRGNKLEFNKLRIKK